MVYKCGICNENVCKTQGSIQCSRCAIWFHSSCSGVTDRQASVIKANKQFNFSCTTCNNNTRDGADSTIKNDINALTSVINNFIRKVEVDQETVKNDLNNLDKKIGTFIDKVENEQRSIKQSFDDSVSTIRNDLASYIKDMKNDIVDCNKFIRHIDDFTTAKISALEDENYMLHRRMNRADIVISGLPIGIEDLSQPIIKLRSYFNISISSSVINHVCYINKRKSILVKFNNVSLRDGLMSAYFKTRSLKLMDFFEGNIASRVYLNDHYSPAAGKLNALCRKLLQKKVITKFRILNGDSLKVKLTMLDGGDVVHNAAECASLLEKSL